MSLARTNGNDNGDGTDYGVWRGTGVVFKKAVHAAGGAV